MTRAFAKALAVIAATAAMIVAAAYWPRLLQVALLGIIVCVVVLCAQAADRANNVRPARTRQGVRSRHERS